MACTCAASSLASESSSDLLYTTANALRGVALQGDAAQLRDLAKRSEVVKISKITPQYRSNAGSVVDTNALNSWSQTGQTGKDVKVAVIDSGLDYTHADFGGPGTTDGYKKAKASTELPGKDSDLYDPKKFVGGYDLAGDSYDARVAGSVPKPDSNPLDCEAGGHGTHVAGTTAGYGVGADDVAGQRAGDAAAHLDGAAFGLRRWWHRLRGGRAGGQAAEPGQRHRTHETAAVRRLRHRPILSHPRARR